MKKVFRVITLVMALISFCFGSYFAYTVYDTSKKIEVAQSDAEESLYNYNQHKNGALQKQYSDMPNIAGFFDEQLAGSYSEEYELNAVIVQTLEQKELDSVKYTFLTYTLAIIFLSIFFALNKKIKSANCGATNQTIKADNIIMDNSKYSLDDTSKNINEYEDESNMNKI